MYDGIMAESVRIAGHGGDEIAAYFADRWDPEVGRVARHAFQNYGRIS